MKKYLFEFCFFNEQNKQGVIFIIANNVPTALKLALNKLEIEDINVNNLVTVPIGNELRVHDDTEMGVYEIVYP